MYTANKRLSYRPDIEGLRAVAVLPVIFYHAGLGFPGGYLGVDVFFVISGYLIIKLIYASMMEGRFSVVEFYQRRIRRLFPALFVMLLVVTGCVLCWMIAPDLRDFGRSLIAAITYVSNFYFYFTNTQYFVASALTKPLLHTWSLGVEEQFYFLAPLFLACLVRLAPRRAHVPAIVLLSVLSFCLSVWFRESEATFYLLPFRGWELGLGGALGLVAPSVHQHRGVAEMVSFCGLAAIAFSMLAPGGNPVWHTALSATGAAAILSSGSGFQGLVHKLLAIRPLCFLGRISYSLYLWHWPVIVALSYGNTGPLAPVWAIVAITVSLVLAVVSWKWIEQPVRTGHWLPGARCLFGAAAIATAGGVAIGFGLLATDGLPGRHPALRGLLDERRLSAPRKDCHFMTPQRARTDDVCTRGALGVPPTFILVGDSHAHNLSKGVFEAALRRRLAGKQFTAPGFRPLPNLSGPRRDLVPAFEIYLRRHPELTTVIVTGFWSFEATGVSYRDLSRPNSDAGPGGSDAAYNAAAMGRAMGALASRFPDRRFILLDDVPTGDDLSPVQNARRIYRGLSPLIGIGRATADLQRKTYEPVLRNIAANHTNVRYIPVLAVLCGELNCPVADSQGHPLYKDGDHLSTYGAAQLAPALDALFSSVIEQARPRS